MIFETVNITEAKYALDPLAFCSKQSTSWENSMIWLDIDWFYKLNMIYNTNYNFKFWE